jgi:hypothetical protein
MLDARGFTPLHNAAEYGGLLALSILPRPYEFYGIIEHLAYRLFMNADMLWRRSCCVSFGNFAIFLCLQGTTRL